MDVLLELEGKAFNVAVAYPGYISGNGLSDNGDRYVQSLIAEVTNAKLFAAKSLIKTYNENWLDEDHPELSSVEFAQVLTLKNITILDEPDYGILYFSDGDMFGGHLVSVTLSGIIPVDAQIGG
jgi:hypothetical protein